jgi:hypothetical protein
MSRWKLGLLAILLMGLLIRIAAAWVWQTYNVDSNFLRFGDSDSYWYHARMVGLGQDYQYGSPDSRIFRAPLYPIFLAPWTWLLANGETFSWSAVFAGRIAGCIAGTSKSVARTIFKSIDATSLDRQILDRQFEMQCGIGAGAFAMLYPGAIGMSIFILSESIFCPLMLVCLAGVWLAIQRWEQDRMVAAFGYLGLSGFLSGAACLSRPSWSLWPAILFPYLAIVVFRLPARSGVGNRLQSRRWMIGCGFYCVGICAAMSPWWIRNYAICGKFVPTTLQVGASLYDGWHLGASGSSDEGMKFVEPFAIKQTQEDAERQAAGDRLDGTYEWRLDRRMRNAAIQWAAENSSDAVRLGLVKLIKTWSPMPVARELGSSAVRWCEAIGYSCIMFFAAIGCWRIRRCHGAWLFAMPCVYFAILHMFFIGSVRYRQPAVLAICVIAGIGIVVATRWINSLITTCQGRPNQLPKGFRQTPPIRFDGAVIASGGNG